ncbi:UNVERIFIED_CONTAM: hypothetical protein K2H54_018981 [Gekko kuhli]
MQNREEERPSVLEVELFQHPFVTVTSNKPVPEESTAEFTVQVKIEIEESEIALQLPASKQTSSDISIVSSEENKLSQNTCLLESASEKLEHASAADISIATQVDRTLTVEAKRVEIAEVFNVHLPNPKGGKTFSEVLIPCQTTEPLIPKKRAVLQNLKELPEATPTELQQLTEVKLLDKQGEDTLQELFIFLRDVTHRLVIDKRFRDFAKLADWYKVPEYETVIQQPMDLPATVSKIDLICSNALEHNPDSGNSEIIRENQSEVIVIPALLVGVFVILLSVILWLYCRNWKIKQQNLSESREKAAVPVPENERVQQKASISEDTSIQLGEMTMDCLLRTAALTLKELEIPREKISQESLEFIQNGSFGGIYRAQLDTTSPGKTQLVILKTLQESATSHEMKDFLERIKFHQFLGPHENIVKLLGCSVTQTPLYMILEDASNGNLLNFLWTCRRDVVTMDGLPFDLTERQVYKIGQQIASALEFLHQKKLFHGDVAARNVVIGRDFTAKLCKLGLAHRSHTCGPSTVTHTVPLKWQAPERLLKKTPSIKSDMCGLFPRVSEFSFPGPSSVLRCILNFQQMEISMVFRNLTVRDDHIRSTAISRSSPVRYPAAP